MHFASLSGLWFLLSAPLIVLLYLLKRQYVDMAVPSDLLWRRVLRDQEANRPWQRLQKQLLLWMQLLAAFLFVLALMQPYIQGRHTAKAHVCFVLDASASMQTLTDQGARFEQAKTALLAYAREQAPDSAYTLLVMKDQPQVLLTRQSGLSGLQQALEQAHPFYGKVGYQEAVSLASALTRDETNGEVRVYTDGQWTEQAAGVVFSVPVVVEQTLEATAPINVSISQFGVKNAAGGSIYQAVAALKNWSVIPVSVKATFYTDSQAVRTEDIQLQAGQQKAIYADRLTRGDVYKLQIEAPQDSLAADNTAYAFPEGNGRIEAAYIGEGNLFLEKALALAKVDSLNVQKNESGAYPPPPKDVRPDLVVLDGVDEARLKGEAWETLLSSTPVWRFASASVSKDGHAAETASPPYIVADHPVSRYIRFQDVHVAGIEKLAVRPWEKPVVSSASAPFIVAGMEEGIPKLTFAFQLQESDLALRSEFPILVQNAVSWLTQFRGGQLGRAIAGERIELALNPEAVRAVWKPEATGAIDMPAERLGESISARQTVPQWPGLYKWVEYNREGRAVQSRLLEVAMDPRESNVNGGANIKLDVSKGGTSKEQGEEALSRQSLAPWLAAILLIVLLLEWEVYRRGLSV